MKTDEFRRSVLDGLREATEHLRELRENGRPENDVAVGLLAEMVKFFQEQLAALDKREQRFLVWSHKHQAWWGPGHAGYTTDLMQAGRYTRAEALDICRNALPGQWKPGKPFPELMIAEQDLVELLEGGKPA
jgi:hypothetical protein